MSNIKVGDYVTCRKPPYTNADGKRFMPMGLAGCKVTWIGMETIDETNTVQEVAHLEWQGYHDKNGPEKFRAPVAWLNRED